MANELAANEVMANEVMGRAVGAGGGSSVVVGTGAVGLEQTRDLEDLMLSAGWLGRDERERATASFTSLFLAFQVSKDAFSRWVQDKIGLIGPLPGDVLRQWRRSWPSQRGLDEQRLKLARPETYKAPVGETASVLKVLAAARDIAKRVGANQVDVRHVFAVFLYAPPGHGDDLAAWKLDREAWATRFRCHVTAGYPAEAAAWRALHLEVFARTLSRGISEVLNWATAIATDARQTTLDARAVFHGMLLDGIRFAQDKVTSSQLVACLGGAEAVEAWVPAPTTPPGSSLALPYDDEVWPIIDRALVFATATGAEGTSASGTARRRLSVRHLAAAFLTDRRALPAFAVLRQAQRTQAGLLAQLRRSIDELATPNDDRARWRQIFDEHREEVFAGYDNDEAHGEDHLDVDTDVDALAGVLASTQVSPPLSVGLFGDWGSGKSFFMERLFAKIKRLSDAAEARPPGESWFVGRRGKVVQVKFNAWHYMDADLWSSLAVCVFDGLSEALKAKFAKACAENLTSIKDQQAALESKQQKVAASASELDKQLAELQAKRAQADVPLVTYVRAVAADVARDPQVVVAAKALRLEGETAAAELEDVKRDLSTVGGTAARVWRAWGSPNKLLVAALVIGLPVIAALVAGAVDRVAAWVSGAVALVASALGAIAWGRKAAVRLAGIANRALDRVHEIEADARSKKPKREQEAEAARARIAAQIADLERDRVQLGKEKADVEAELARLENPDKRTLQELILQRAASDDYRKKLGVVSAVHKDFEELSGFLLPDKAGPDVERIILYIDDLDRCSPEQVVQVLQAIHVILSLPLFVVVVAVDSRWLVDSLTAYYRKQFPGDDVDSSRPQQYLEKIFQIPFTLLPMSATGYEALTGALLERHVDRAEVTERAVAPGPAAAAHAPYETPSVTTGAVTAPPAVRRATPSSELELKPRGLRLEPAEVAFLRTLSGLIGSPRSTKRLVNLYRIVRSTLDDVALDQLISGGYRVTQLWLAFVVGHPALGAELFDAILSGTLTAPAGLVQWCKARCQAPKLDVRQRAALRALEAHQAELADWPAVKTAVRRVARFSFETGRVLGYYVGDAA